MNIRWYVCATGTLKHNSLLSVGYLLFYKIIPGKKYVLTYEGKWKAKQVGGVTTNEEQKPGKKYQSLFIILFGKQSLNRSGLVFVVREKLLLKTIEQNILNKSRDNKVE